MKDERDERPKMGTKNTVRGEGNGNWKFRIKVKANPNLIEEKNIGGHKDTRKKTHPGCRSNVKRKSQQKG